MRAEIIAIGDELTSGERLDTNTQWLSKRLTELGVEVMFHTTVGDDLAANASVFQVAIDRADMVVTTGGLGPTADDLTREALAAAMGVKLELDEPSLHHIKSLFTSRGRTMPARNERQAYLPTGTSPIANPHGTAPGVHARVARPTGGVCHVFSLPGVPAEMHDMWAASVAPAVRKLDAKRRVIRHRAIKIFGPGESQLEAMLPDLIRRGREPRVGITASSATLTLRITATGEDEAACLAAIEPTAQQIYAVAGRFIFGEGDEELQHVVLRLLAGRGETVATDESLTRGLLASWLAEVDPAGEMFLGGGVTRGIQDAGAAADAARVRYNATYGLAIGSAHADETVEVSLADGERKKTERFMLGGHPTVIGPRIAKCALNMLRLQLTPENLLP